MLFRRALSLLVLALAARAIDPNHRLQAQERPWSVGVEGTYNSFSGGATDQSGSRILPTDRFGFSVLGARALGPWLLRMEVGMATGHIVGSDSGSTVELTRLTTSMPRYRIEPLGGRLVTGLGSGGLFVYVGPTLDWWRLDGYTRFTLGGEARLAVQAPLGRFVLENYVGVGIAPQPFPPADLTPEITTQSLVTFTLGLSLRYRI